MSDAPNRSNEALVHATYALFEKEVLRFWKVALQTVIAPLITASLYLLVFSHVLRDRLEVFPGVPYAAFIIPGLMMMSILQNAFANTSSSLIQSKVTGNIVFVLLSPMGPGQFLVGLVAASIVRGLAVGFAFFLFAYIFVDLPLAAPWALLAFGVIGAGGLGAMGIIGGLWAEKFDQIAAFQNFLIMPLTFLAGVFYSVHSLPPFWGQVSHLNPFFYMIDGFRYGFLGHSDTPVAVSLVVSSAFFLFTLGLAFWLLKSGYKLRQ